MLWLSDLAGPASVLVKREGIPWVRIRSGKLHGVGRRRQVEGTLAMIRGFLKSFWMMARRRPDAVFTTGGYSAVPVLLSAWMWRVPIVVYFPDIEPAASVKFALRLARRGAVTVEDALAYVPAGKGVVVGYPLREEVRRWQREEARAALGLPQDEHVLLVFGGSQGARSLNEAVAVNIRPLLEMAHVVHLCGGGRRDEAAQVETLSLELRARYHPYEYLHERMGAALAAADLAVARSGASTLGELPYFGLPAILVPYPYAWRYQSVNAQWLAERGAAVVVEDARIAERLVPLVTSLFGDAARLRAMREASHALARDGAALRLARLLQEVAAVDSSQGEEAKDDSY